MFDLAIAEQDAAAGRSSGAGQHFDQLALAVTFHAGDTEDFTLVQLERNAPQCGMPRSDSAVTFSTRKATGPGVAGFLSTRSNTSRPTIRRAISASLVSLVSRWPTTLPRRITVMRSEISRTSFSLWEMKIIVLPVLTRSRRTPKSSMAS